MRNDIVVACKVNGVPTLLLVRYDTYAADLWTHLAYLAGDANAKITDITIIGQLTHQEGKE